MMTKRLDPGELLEWFEHIVQTALMAKDESVEIDTFVAVELLERLKLAKRPRRGQGDPWPAVVLEREDVSAARSLKKNYLPRPRPQTNHYQRLLQASKPPKHFKPKAIGTLATGIEYRMIRPGRKSRK
jgi:hypothetical protein